MTDMDAKAIYEPLNEILGKLQKQQAGHALQIATLALAFVVSRLSPTDSDAKALAKSIGRDLPNAVQENRKILREQAS